jgi:DNA processing protein
MAQWVVDHVRGSGLTSFGIRIHQAGEYPTRLRDADHPVELLYYSGDWDLVATPSVAIVGSRDPSDQGVLRARKLTSLLVESGWTAVSGLAAGIDEAVHTEALRRGGRTIAVIGTPLTETYPKHNTELQARLAKEHLVVSQVPFRRYSGQDWRANRAFFPERNVTMSALTEATVIIEAGNTSGTLTQARAALRQRRKLFILNSCFERTDLKWPQEFEKLGALRIRDFDQILAELPKASGS